MKDFNRRKVCKNIWNIVYISKKKSYFTSNRYEKEIYIITSQENYEKRIYLIFYENVKGIIKAHVAMRRKRLYLRSHRNTWEHCANINLWMYKAKSLRLYLFSVSFVSIVSFFSEVIRKEISNYLSTFFEKIEIYREIISLFDLLCRFSLGFSMSMHPKVQ